MTKAFCLALLLGWLILAPQAVETADASASAQANNSSTNSVGSGSIKLTAVASAASTNSETSLIPSYTSDMAFFYLKNFGTTTLTGFSVTQTNTTSKLRYCIGQVFKTGSSTKCADASFAILVGNGASLPGNTFSIALPSGTAYAFSSTRTKNSGENAISVSVSSSDVIPTVTRF